MYRTLCTSYDNNTELDVVGRLEKQVVLEKLSIRERNGDEQYINECIMQQKKPMQFYKFLCRRKETQ